VLYGTVYRVRTDLLACRGDSAEVYKQLRLLLESGNAGFVRRDDMARLEGTLCEM
jgi:hypothetical protein